MAALPQSPDRAFDLAHSLRIDRIVIRLDEHPATLRRALLRLEKRVAERNVPGFTRKAA